MIHHTHLHTSANNKHRKMQTKAHQKLL